MHVGSSKFFVEVDPNASFYIALINRICPPSFEEVAVTGKKMGNMPEGDAMVAFAILITLPRPLTASPTEV